MPEVIDRNTLLDMIQHEPVTLIDTLPANAYARGHIPGAISIPSDDILDRAPDRLPDKDTTIVVYCKNGPCLRSGRAAERLTGLGYTRVFDYHLGRDDWTEAGLALEPGEAP